MLFGVIAAATHDGNGLIQAVQAGAQWLQLLTELPALLADALDQPAALDGKFNQVLISLPAAVLSCCRSSPSWAMLVAKMLWPRRIARRRAI